MTRDQTFDVAIAGGGLSAGVTALALLHRYPEARIAIAEAGPRLGGNHTWCYSLSDVPTGAGPITDALAELSWPGYDVSFPDRRRRIDRPYAGFRGERLHQVVGERVTASGGQIVTGRGVAAVADDSLALIDGGEIRARVTIDARNTGEPPAGKMGYQSFVGIELELDRPHALERAVLMDAMVPQRGGYRFFYVLPLSPTDVLVEDTRFGDEPGLDVQRARTDILEYARQRGLVVRGEGRIESGVLPMPWSAPLPHPAAGPVRIGAAAGWYHPATGYSLPTALRVALAIADAPLGTAPTAELAALARRMAPQLRYAQWLNRLAFRWFDPADRWTCFSRFYALPEDTIARFYRLEMTAADRARILFGRPPRGFSLRARLAS